MNAQEFRKKLLDDFIFLDCRLADHPKVVVELQVVGARDFYDNGRERSIVVKPYFYHPEAPNEFEKGLILGGSTIAVGLLGSDGGFGALGVALAGEPPSENSQLIWNCAVDALTLAELYSYSILHLLNLA